MKGRRIVLAVTGASGSIYGLKLARELLATGNRLTMLITGAGFDVIRHETGMDWRGDEPKVTAFLREYFEDREQRLNFYGEKNFLAPVASGSAAPARNRESARACAPLTNRLRCRLRPHFWPV